LTARDVYKHNVGLPHIPESVNKPAYRACFITSLGKPIQSDRTDRNCSVPR